LEFNEYESIRYWMDTLATRSKNTKDNYRGQLRLFCKAINMTPDELIQKRKDDLKSNDLYKRHRIEILLKKNIAELQKQDKSIATLKKRYAAVRSFFECHYMRLELLRTDAPSGESIGKEPADKEQIRKMIDVADPLKFRCMISFLKDIGWRISDVLRLKWSDINDMGDGFWHFKKLTKKKHVVANGFVGPETTGLMELYRKKRERRGEKIDNDSPLFLSEMGGHIKSIPWVSQKIGDIARMIGAKDVSAHSLRKFFQNTLEAPELHIQKTWIKQMMGKKLNPGDKPYVQHRVEKLFEAYKRAYDHLRIIETVSLVELQKRQIIVEELTGKLMAGTPLTDKDHKNIRRYRIRLGFKPKKKQRTEPNGGCENGVNCGERFEQIPEANLLEYLRQGWQIVKETNNGKEVIVRKQ